MIQTGLMQMVHDAASHAATRQSHIARNIANADTPGYRATDVTSFADSLDEMNMAFKSTRDTHLKPEFGQSDRFDVIERAFESSPNANNVSLEHEMMESTHAQQQHEMALSIYSSARNILRSALGRGN